MTITERLSRLQKSLKAPKEKNQSVAYKSRSAEQILEAAKEVLEEGEYVICQDEMIVLGDRFYVKSTAIFGHGKEIVSSIGYARESEHGPLSSSGKPLMQQPQVTGASSSYARKYALGGLFAIDDSKDDPDKSDHSDAPVKGQITRENKMDQRDILYEIAASANDVEMDSVIEKYTKAMDEMPDVMLGSINDQIAVRKGQFASKTEIPFPKFGFIDVEEASHYFNGAKTYIQKATDAKKLSAWVSDKDYKLKGLDGMLDAMKYQNDNGSPYRQIVKLYEAKIEELK